MFWLFGCFGFHGCGSFFCLLLPGLVRTTPSTVRRPPSVRVCRIPAFAPRQGSSLIKCALRPWFCKHLFRRRNQLCRPWQPSSASSPLAGRWVWIVSAVWLFSFSWLWFFRLLVVSRPSADDPEHGALSAFHIPFGDWIIEPGRFGVLLFAERPAIRSCRPRCTPHDSGPFAQVWVC